MLKGNQTIIGLEKYENEATHNTHVNAEKKKTNKNQGFWVTASHMLEQIYIRMSLACMRKLDHAYANPQPEDLIYTETEQKPNKAQNVKSSNLTCLKT